MRGAASEHPDTWNFDYPIFHAESRAEWRAWLEAHHGSAPGVWLCSWRNSHGGPVCPYSDAVEEAICFGWIDSTVTILDAVFTYTDDTIKNRSATTTTTSP